MNGNACWLSKTLKSTSYDDILKRYDKKLHLPGFLFKQDNAPVHTTSNIKKCVLKKNGKSLMKAYNWLTELNLIPPNLLNLSQEQLKKHLKLVNDLYITDNKELFVSIFVAKTFNRAR